MPATRGCTLRPEWQCPLHCHSTSNVPKRYVQARVAVPTTRGCTLGPEWQCRPPGAARSGPSGSAPYTAPRRRTYGLHALTLPLDVERTETARSGPSGSANRTGLHAQGRVAVPLTLPLDVERTGCTPSHCHSTSSVPRRRARARVAVPTTCGCTLRPEWQCRPRGTARSGPSGSAGSGGLRASSRCADARARLPDVSRASGSRALFETDPLRAVERLLARQVGMAVQLASPM